MLGVAPEYDCNRHVGRCEASPLNGEDQRHDITVLRGGLRPISAE